MKKSILFMLIVTMAMLLVLPAEEGRSQSIPSEIPILRVDTDLDPIGPSFFRFLVRVYGNQSCSGTLVHPNWFLTAAHCVDDPTASDLETVAVQTPNQFYSTGRVILHPNYRLNVQNVVPDAALVEITGSGIPAADRIPIRIASPTEDARYVRDGGITTLFGGGGNYSGWGFNRNNRLVLQTPETCAITSQWGSVAVNEYALCAGTVDVAEDGDSGGPYTIMDSSNEFVQVGIHNLSSPGSGSNRPGHPLVMTRTAKIYDWVTSYVQVESTPDYRWSVYHPQVFIGEGITTDLVITNHTGWASGAAEVRFFDSEGQRVDLLSPENSKFNLRPYGTLTIPLASVIDFEFNGSARVLSEDQALYGFARFRIEGLGTAGISASASREGFSVPYRSGIFRTGLAIHNTGDGRVLVSVAMYDSSGNRLRSADVWVAANGKTAQFINELFPEYFVPGLESSGQVTVRSVRTSNSSGPVTDARKMSTSLRHLH